MRQRVVPAATTHLYYSDHWRPVETRKDSSTTAASQYYWGSRHRDDLVRRDRSIGGGALNETRYVLMDYYNPMAITDAAGAVTERYAFSAFGVHRILTPAFGERATSECDFTFAFQGQFLDIESGLLNYGYRYYSPHLGRWLSKDPLQEYDNVNPYIFVSNRPTDSTDAFGLTTLVLPIAGAIVVAAAIIVVWPVIRPRPIPMPRMLPSPPPLPWPPKKPDPRPDPRPPIPLPVSQSVECVKTGENHVGFAQLICVYDCGVRHASITLDDVGCAKCDETVPDTDSRLEFHDF